MNYLHLSITELHNLLLKGEITPLQLTKLAIEAAKKDTNNSFEYICEKEAIGAVKNLDKNKKNNLLWGIPFVLKDNFSTKDIPTTASSNILNGYVPVFSCDTYLRLAEQGAILIGKTTMDELAMGGTGTTGHLGTVYNPWDPKHERLIGGSSSGSASACSGGIVPFAIGSDTGDSVRKPASYAGLVGLKPTWGRISRFGLFPFAQSLDHVSYFTRNITDAAILLSVLAGKDEKDCTSSSKPVDDYLGKMNGEVKGLRVAIIDEIINSIEDKDIVKEFTHNLELLKQQGVIINHVSIDIDLCRSIFPTYMIISCVEAASNNSTLDGIKYGPRYEGDDYESVVFEARTKGFSEMIKRRFVLGSYALFNENREEVFVRAQRCRRLIVDTFNNILKDNDLIYLPSAPTVAPYFNKTIDRLSDEYLIGENYAPFANLGGLPSLTLPLGFKDGLPFGGNLTGRAFDEVTVLKMAKKIEEITGLKDLVAKDYK